MGLNCWRRAYASDMQTEKEESRGDEIRCFWVNLKKIICLVVGERICEGETGRQLLLFLLSTLLLYVVQSLIAGLIVQTHRSCSISHLQCHLYWNMWLIGRVRTVLNVEKSKIDRTWVNFVKFSWLSFHFFNCEHRLAEAASSASFGYHGNLSSWLPP